MPSNFSSIRSALKAGIVVTMADAEESVDEFIKYHLAIGFSRIYIFVDDNSLLVKKKLERYPQVRCLMRDFQLAQLWRSTPVYADKKKFILVDQEVMVRQEMNFYVAFKMAREEGIDWLLHIDLDELFYPNGESPIEHFAMLQKNGVTCVTYLNYECIPDPSLEHSIYSSTIFKINFFRHKHWVFNREQREFIRNNSWVKPKYFNFYQNGKSAINTFGVPQVYDVHSIIVPGERRFGKTSDPLILHFPCATKKEFLKKYRRLGNFGDYWMGYLRAGDYIERTHLEARDVVVSGGDERIDDFFSNNFYLSSKNIEALIEKKMAVKIDFHQKILSAESRVFRRS